MTQIPGRHAVRFARSGTVEANQIAESPHRPARGLVTRVGVRLDSDAWIRVAQEVGNRTKADAVLDPRCRCGVTQRVWRRTDHTRRRGCGVERS